MLWHDLPDALGYARRRGTSCSLLPAVGAALVLAARRCSPGTAATARWRASAPLADAVAYVPGVVLAAIGSLAFGAVLGPEAPLIALGSAVGLAITHFVRRRPCPRRVLAMAGAVLCDLGAFRRAARRRDAADRGRPRAGEPPDPAPHPRTRRGRDRLPDLTGFGDWGGLEPTGLSSPGCRRTTASTSATCSWPWSRAS